MNTESNAQQIMATCKEQWMLHSIPFIPGTSNVGLNEDFFKKDPEPEELEKVIKIFEQREHIRQHSLVTAVIGEEDFLPLSFLQRGGKQGAAVCRIARYFSLLSFQEFIKMIQEAILKWDTAENFNTVAKLKEIFLIPDSVAQEIFSLTNPVENDANKLLENLQALTGSQLAKINPIPIGTGFLVGGTHLLTNHHVLPSPKIAQECVAQFNYEDDENSPQASIDYEFDPKALFVSEPSLDYTLVQLKSGMFTRQAGYRMGWIQLIEDDAAICPGVLYLQSEENVPQDVITKLLKTGLRSSRRIFIDVQQRKTVQKLKSLQGKDSGDLVFVIQHPKGRRKQISIGYNNKVIDYGLFKDFLRYETDTDYGSSGSPVFNAQWQLVALHHAAIPDNYGKEKDKPAKIIAQQGVRIFSIIGDLKNKSLKNPKLKIFIQDFVITAEQLNCPPLPTAVRLNGGMSGIRNGYFDCGNHESLDVNDAITCEAWVAKQDDENGIIFCRTDESKENGSGYWMWFFKGRIVVQLRKFVDETQHDVHIYETKQLAPQDKLWHHIAFTWSQSNKVQIYIDGEKKETNDTEIERSFTDNGELEENTKGPLKEPLDKLNGSLWIGYSLESGAWLGGAIAEARLWKTARSQTEIQETMYQRLKGNDTKEGLIGLWQFEEDKARDIYTYNLASSNVRSSVPSIEPFSSTSKNQLQFGLELNGKDDYIDCGSFVVDKAITFETWVKSNDGNQLSIIAGQGGLWGEPGYCLWWSNGKIRVELQGHEGDRKVQFAIDTPDDDWHHIAFTWSSDLPNVCIYIDGYRYQDKYSFEGPIGISSYNLCIGRNKEITFYYFKGAIAEVRLWSVARSEDQIKDAMNRILRDDEIKDPTLAGYWQLNEVTGSEASNLANQGSVGNQPGLVNGGTWLKPRYAAQYSKGDYAVPLGNVKCLKATECPSALLLPCGLKFNSEGDQVTCNANRSLDVTDAITVEAWVKHQFGNCLIVGRGGYDDDGYSLCWHDGKIRVMLKAADQTAIIDTRENAPVDQVWHHIAFTWDKVSQEIFIYVDGRQQDCVVVEGQSKSISHAGQAKSTGLFSGSLADLKTDLVLGRKTEEGQYYNVAIAEVRLWKVVRPQDQIKTNMTCRLSRRDDDWKDLLGYWRLDDGGTQAHNLVSDSNHGTIQDAQWYPAPPHPQA